MAKKTKASNADEVLRMMYPDLPTSDDDVVEEKKQQTAPEDKIAQLEARIREFEGASRQAPASVPQRAIEAAPLAPQIDYAKAPDPIQDPQGYAKFVRDATQAQINYEKEAYNWQQRQHQSQAQKVEGLWGTFRKDYKDKAEDEERVEIAAQRVIAKAEKQGLDLNKYMFEQSPQFLKAVADEIDKLWPGQSAQTDDDDDDDDDAFVPGGHIGGREQKPTERKKEAKYGELGSDIVEWQKKMGLAY